MAATKILLDTGPLVGYLAGKDAHHAWAEEQWDRLFAPCLTCEAVVSEAVFLLLSKGMAAARIGALLAAGSVILDFELEPHRAEVFALLEKYSDRPMSLADGCLVRMAELHRDCRVFTTDPDFKVYRRFRHQVIPLIAPWEPD